MNNHGDESLKDQPPSSLQLPDLFNQPNPFKNAEQNHLTFERSVSPFEITHSNDNSTSGLNTSTLNDASTANKSTDNPNFVDANFVEILQERIDLRLASSQNPSAVMELDLDGNIRYLSKNWESIVGTNIKKLLYKPISNIIIGNNEDDLKVFNNAIEQMVKNDATYKVKFVTATNDRSNESAANSDHSSGKLTPTNSINDNINLDDLSNENLIQLNQELNEVVLNEIDKLSTGTSISDTSSLSSKVSNNGQVIELEAQGILIHDPKTSLPTHSVWTIKPFTYIDLDLTLPEHLINLLGFGSEIFEGYLLSLKDLGIIDEESVPQPKSILCRICENNIPAWFIEKHSDLCIVEHRLNEELQYCHDLIADQKDLILKISESLWFQQHENFSSSNSSSSSLLSISSNSGYILDYKGKPLPSVSSSHDFSSSSSSSPRLATHMKSVSSVQSIFQSKKFPFGILQRLIELCDEALQINPAERLEGDGVLQFSPNTERAINSVANWKVFETSDLAIRAMVEDTQTLVNDKIDTLSRLISILQYSDKIKQEVDELVLQTVQETVCKIKEQTRINEQQNHSSSISKKSSFYYTANASGDISSDLSIGNDSGTGTGSNNEKTLSEPIDLSRNSSNQNLTLIHSPQPSRTRSPSSRLFVEQFNDLRSNHSITPKDILLRGRSSPVDILRVASPNISTSSRGSSISLSGHNSRHNSKDINHITDSFHDLELTKKTSEMLSNSSSFSSPRRHLSPAPYVEKQSLSSFQRNTNSRFDTSSPFSSPSINHTEINDSLAQPPPMTQHFQERRSNSGGSINASTNNLNQAAPGNSHHLSISLNVNLSKNQMKPPLSPLLVSLTPSTKSTTGTIKDYEVLKAISKGAFGSVFLAKKKITGDYVAIKCLKKRDMIAKNQILNVRSERAVMMKQTDSPYVVQLYNSFQTRDYLYLVMEYLNGGDCSTLLKMLGTLGNEWAKRYIAEVVVGIDDIHRRGIIHRDLKPDNLLIDSKGHLKLTDFGLSRIGVLGRQHTSHRKSSISDHSIEIFRKSLAQGANSPLANVSNLSAHDSPSSATQDPYHKRNSSVTPFSLSPTLEYNKLTPATTHQHLISQLTPLTVTSSNSGSAMLSSPNMAYIESFSNAAAPTPPPNTGGSFSSNAGGLPPPLALQQLGAVTSHQGNRSGSFLRHNSTKNRTGSGSSGLESPLLKPHLPRTFSESSFAVIEDDFQVSPSQNPNSLSITSFALFDPSKDENTSEVKKFVGTPDYLSPETIEGKIQGEYSDWWSVGCILFEFLFGYPPFHADSPDLVFKNILAGNIDWPPLSKEEENEICPPSAKDLIKKLLTLDPEKRLGSNGAQEIMHHPYFKEINWLTLYEEEPSFIPTLDDPESTDYFDSRGADISHFPKEDSDEDAEAPVPPALAPAVLHLSINIGKSIKSSEMGSPSIPSAKSLTPTDSHENYKRERRGSKLADPSEFGSFNFRNLNVLEKANKDVINRLKNEHLEHRNSFSSSSSDSTPISRSRGYSFTGTTNNPGSPFKRPVSPVAAINRPLSPNKVDSTSSTASESGQLPTALQLHHQVSTPTAFLKHERVGSTVSTYSSGDEFPFDMVKHSPSHDLPPASSPNAAGGSGGSSSHNLSKQRPSVHSLSKQVLNKSVNDLHSPSSSDTEDSKSSALLRVRKRRESSRRLLGSSSSITNLANMSSSVENSPLINHQDSAVANELDVLYCDPIPIVRHTISKLLERLGCIVVSVGDGDELVRRATSQVKFDLIFTAIKIPKVDAIDAIKLIKYTTGVNSDTPVVALTGFAKDALQSGVFDEVLERPIDFEAIKNTILKFQHGSVYGSISGRVSGRGSASGRNSATKMMRTDSGSGSGSGSGSICGKNTSVVLDKKHEQAIESDNED